jgi:hypothetical protein
MSATPTLPELEAFEAWKAGRKRLWPLPPPDVRLRHLTEQIHALGVWPLFELLREVEAGANLRERLEDYARLDPEILRLNGSDRLPPLLSLVKRDARERP